MSCSGLIIAAPASNSGKTFITLGLLRAMKNAGLDIASAKIGPDYIDPGFHSAATEKPCPNLDGWAMRESSLAHQFNSLSKATAVICEGVMGLFDGASLAASDHLNDGSPASLARRTGWPVVLVIDASSQAASVAALIKGFLEFDPQVTVAGVIFNKVGSSSHITLIQTACEKHLPNVRLYGFVPRRSDLELPARHLGLVMAGEHHELDNFLDRAGSFLSEHVDLQGLYDLARQSAYDPVQGTETAFIDPLGQRIAVARDPAFCFAYEHLLDYWRSQGAELMFFSPLNDEGPNEDCDSVYLPGGYPELYAESLSNAHSFQTALRLAAQQKKFIFAECGGYMVLGKIMIDKQATPHPMAGLLDLTTSFEKRKLHLGYRQILVQTDLPFAKKGTALRGHEFHYARVLEENGSAPFSVQNAKGDPLGAMGLYKGSVCASFMHLIDRA